MPISLSSINHKRAINLQGIQMRQHASKYTVVVTCQIGNRIKLHPNEIFCKEILDEVATVMI